MAQPPRDDETKLEQRARQAREIGIYTAIPMMLVIGPVMGWLLGRWAGGRWGHETTFEAVGAVLGLAAAGRQVQLVFQRQAQSGSGSDS